MKVKVKPTVIRELRTGKGWTQEKLVEVASVHTRTIQRIENSRDASTQSLNALARALDVEPATLIDIKTKRQTIDHRPTALIPMSYKEKQYVKKCMQRAEKMGPWLSREWVAWALFLVGGILTVNILLITEANLNRTVILTVMIPGTAIGLLLMLLGGLRIHLAEKAKEEMILYSLVQKSLTFRAQR